MDSTKSKDEAFYYIQQYVNRDNRVAWIGSKPVLSSEAMPLDSSTNYRVHSSLHKQFGTVLLVESELFSKYPHCWRLVLDEAIRLIPSEGILVFRTRDSENGTLFSLKSVLSRNPNTKTELVSQKNFANEIISTFKIQRLNLEHYNNSSWTVGILSNGTKNENVVNLVNKAKSLSSSVSLEFIIAGPKIDEIDDREDVRFVFTDTDELPRISEKKHLIMQKARNSNVLIIHDRYQLSDNFFKGFEDFGYDFDFITVRQKYPSGSEFPAYLYFPVNKKIWQSPVKVEKFNQVYDSSFINGGLIILKKHLADECNFNSLLLHNEAEDVEISMQMCSLGLYPRINTISLAHTLGIDESYTESFISSDSFKRVKVFSIRRLMLTVWLKIPEKVRKNIRGSGVYEKAKTYYRS
ncbi:hypothetical protein K6Q96_04390 [Grimontia kaedaensis]|uniref:Uncharacterized protein n=1 Tax=Grimontia kaedaensis TaxID=2872157 RepID=A0ABY4WX14_9GAMM|nr:hypothetical protein [Grimontia kaedaensis]USH03262.1 hypothetical protein K6Q96_04390 [Grimontia kaedaensis]